MKRYFDNTREEKLAFSEPDLNSAINLEAVERGIAIPVSLENLLKQHPFVGFTTPGDAVFFYEVCCPQSYGSGKPTGLCFKTIEEARNAIQNGLAIESDGYGINNRQKVIYGDFVIREVFISLTKPKTFAIAVEEAESAGGEGYNKLCEECCKDLQGLRQAEYDQQVNQRKRQEYIALAGGDEEIAKRFWNKSERGEFPEA